MALATRCPHCLTTFKVAQDQLKLRAGLVRCGACKEVFNGIEHLLPAHLQDAPLPAPAPGSTSPAPRQSAPASSAPASDHRSRSSETAHSEPDASASEQESDTPGDDPLTRMTLINFSHALDADEPVRTETGSKPARSEPTLMDTRSLDWDYGTDDGTERTIEDHAHAEDLADLPPIQDTIPQETLSTGGDVASDNESDDAVHEQLAPEVVASVDPLLERREPQLGADTDASVAPPGSEETSADAEPANWARNALFADTERSGADDEPEFVQQAKRQARRRRIQTWLLSLGSTVLLLSALAQAMYSFRAQLAVRIPETRPALVQMCSYLKCRIELPSQIEQLAIESDELQNLAEQPDISRMTLLLRNSSDTAQTWPNIELTLDDSNGKVLARKVFGPTDYLDRGSDLSKGFAPHSEQTVKILLNIAELKAAGYHVGVFYP